MKLVVQQKKREKERETNIELTLRVWCAYGVMYTGLGGPRWRESHIPWGSRKDKCMHAAPIQQHTSGDLNEAEGRAEKRAQCYLSVFHMPDTALISSSQQPCRQELTSPFYRLGNGTWEKLMSSLKATDLVRSRFWIFFRIHLASLAPYTALHVSRGWDSSESIKRAGSGERWAWTSSALRTLPALNFWAFDWSTPQFLKSTVIFSK